MIEVRQTANFATWLGDLADRRASEVIVGRIVRVQSGLMGDVKFFEGIGELRIDYCPGYRVYFVQRGKTLILLLCGGHKGSQQRDIAKARQLLREINDGN